MARQTATVAPEVTLALGLGLASVGLYLLLQRREEKPRALVAKDLQSSPLTVEDIARNPGRATLGSRGKPVSVTFAPRRGATQQGPGDATDGELYYLQSAEGGHTLRLLRCDLSAGVTKEMFGADHVQEGNLSEAEKQRRERLRDMSTGVRSYQWSRTDGVMLVPVGNELYVSRDGGESFTRCFDPAVLDGAHMVVKGGATTAPAAAQDSVVDPRLSADGSKVTFVYDNEVYVAETSGGSGNGPRQVTHGARGTQFTHGVSNYIAQEEMDRFEGFWLSPGGSRLAFERADDSHIEVFRLMHSGRDNPTHQEDLRYPFSGAPNPRCRLAVVDVPGRSSATAPPTAGEVVWMDTEAIYGEDSYLARVWWVNQGTEEHLFAVLQNRPQTELCLVRFDLASGKPTVLVREAHKAFVNLSVTDLFAPMCNGTKALWGSERDGFQHLYIVDLIQPEGEVAAEQLTSGAWVVDNSPKPVVDEKGGEVFFHGNRGDAKQKHLMRVDLATKEVSVITEGEPGTHACVVDAASGRFVDTWSSSSKPYAVALKSLSTGAVIQDLWRARDVVGRDLQRFRLTVPHFSAIRSADKEVDLNICTFEPDPKVFGPGPYPLVVALYGGPHVQYVKDCWEYGCGDIRTQHFVSRGFMVLKLDNRGSARQGLAFENAIHANMGDLEVHDQAEGVRHLVRLGKVDPTRVGVIGWSYGGYLSAMCLARAPDVFHAAVSGAPVTSWDGYDTHYTERYMMTPQTNPGGYHSSSVMTHAGDIRGKLMLIHGLIDENVHFRHTARLVDTLIKKQINHDLMLFPNERHMPRSLPDRVYMESRIFTFLRESLMFQQ